MYALYTSTNTNADPGNYALKAKSSGFLYGTNPPNNKQKQNILYLSLGALYKYYMCVCII